MSILEIHQNALFGFFPTANFWPWNPQIFAPVHAKYVIEFLKPSHLKHFSKLWTAKSLGGVCDEQSCLEIHFMGWVFVSNWKGHCYFIFLWPCSFRHIIFWGRLFERFTLRWGPTPSRLIQHFPIVGVYFLMFGPPHLTSPNSSFFQFTCNISICVHICIYIYMYIYMYIYICVL